RVPAPRMWRCRAAVQGLTEGVIGKSAVTAPSTNGAATSLAILAVAKWPLHRAKTYSTSALVWSLSSGVLATLPLAAEPIPDVIAKYCLLLTSNVIGGVEIPAPTLIFHSSSSVVSS